MGGVKGWVLQGPDGRYWGTDAKTGLHGWTWAPSLAAVYDRATLVAAGDTAVVNDPIDSVMFAGSRFVVDPVGGR